MRESPIHIMPEDAAAWFYRLRDTSILLRHLNRSSEDDDTPRVSNSFPETNGDGGRHIDGRGICLRPPPILGA